MGCPWTSHWPPPWAFLWPLLDALGCPRSVKRRKHVFLCFWQTWLKANLYINMFHAPKNPDLRNSMLSPHSYQLRLGVIYCIFLTDSDIIVGATLHFTSISEELILASQSFEKSRSVAAENLTNHHIVRSDALASCNP